MEERAKIPVGPPCANPTKSYWQTPPDPEIADMRTTDDLPSEADYVIIGCGISGASIAFNILEKTPDASVVILEARQACSGATGRNGGHTKPASYRAFISNEESYGLDEAIRIAKLEYSNRSNTIAFARKHNIDCDLHPCQTADILLDADQLAASIKAIKYMNKVLPTGAEHYSILSADEAARKFYTPHALGAFEYEAGSIQPYKFVMGILRLALARGLNLQTNTPANSLSRDPSPDGHWHITTPRGTISTRRCILATNGYTPYLVPQLQGIVVPLRGQMSVQRPGLNLPNGGSLATTYSFVYRTGYEYMIPRPKGSKHAGDICIGGGWGRLPDEGASEFGLTDDSALNPTIAAYLADCTVDYFGAANWGADDPAGRVRQQWTGIMGTSADGLPYVGELPGPKGLWASVSFNGHGMSIAFNAARGLVQMLFGEEEELEAWFPRSYRVSAERLARSKFEGRRHVRMPDREGLNGHV